MDKSRSVHRLSLWLGSLFILLSPVTLADRVVVTIQGIEGEPLNNARLMTAIARQQEESLTPHQIRYLHTRAPEQIKRALEPFGFYQAQVTPELNPPTDSDATWHAVYRVTTGAPVRIRRTDIRLVGDAGQDPLFQRWRKDFPLREGDVLAHAPYEAAKQSLLRLASENGYLDARFVEHRIAVDPDLRQADLTIVFDSGPQYCLNRVAFQQEQFRAQILKKYVPFQPGDPYRTDQILDLKTNLLASRYFSQVEVTTEQATDRPHCVNLLVRPTLNAREFYQARLGFGTDSGVRLGLDAGVHYLNRWGHRLNGGIGASQNKKKLLGRAQYVLPSLSSRERFWDARLDYRAEDFTSSDIGEPSVDGTTRVTDLYFSVAHHRERAWFDLGFEESLELRYLLEKYALLPLLFTPEDQELLLLFIDEGQIDVLQPDYKILMADASWKVVRTDDPIYTTSGYAFDFGLRAAKDGLGSNLSFWQAELGAEWILSPHSGSRILLKTRAAYTKARTVDSLSLLQGAEELPINANVLPKLLQYRTGGDNSVRGYEFEELSGGENTLVGGKHLLTASVQYEYRILENWSVAVFSDAGNVFNRYSQLEIKQSAGLGVRWHSPVGLVRTDFAFPLNDAEAKSNFRFHLIIGPDF